MMCDMHAVKSGAIFVPAPAALPGRVQLPVHGS